MQKFLMWTVWRASDGAPGLSMGNVSFLPLALSAVVLLVHGSGYLADHVAMGSDHMLAVICRCGSDERSNTIQTWLRRGDPPGSPPFPPDVQDAVVHVIGWEAVNGKLSKGPDTRRERNFELVFPENS